ncbi:MAG TPA: Ku protein, partial [Thermoanaerobaculia bacterium]
MAARAIWKGVIQFGATELPVKLYSAVSEKSVHFRLLHKTDHAPVKQQLVSSESGEVVEYEDVKKAFPVSRGKLVVLDDEELEAIEPKPSRDIEITR